CLGHIGVAREVSVLWSHPLQIPDLQLNESARPAAESVSVVIEAPELCPQYSARIIRGIKVGPSPDWMVKRLQAVGINPVNNVVDITNYVLYETGQPLHAFDLSKLRGDAAGKPAIVVRRAAEGESLEAIDHNTYELNSEMCVIADAVGPVALAGIMGGAPTEVAESTTDLLIEAAEFAQLATR
ncbi:MAG: phenylalanine--tRNA ligase subunit beta, partial [Verrucomicrobiales bacterium]|nr:phenylalanine--tRNA ligase subunit beta [Verrucomicrobiales bacterium]